MRMKYVRFEGSGFVVFPDSDRLWHAHVGSIGEARFREAPVSAGFVTFEQGKPVCTGKSESLSLPSKPEDSAALAEQLGID